MTKYLGGIVAACVLLNAASAMAASDALSWSRSAKFDERVTTISPVAKVDVVINAPGRMSDDNSTFPRRLIFFTLPAGNTIPWTIGRKTGPGDDWHFNIQHIGAQTRRLRELLTSQDVYVAYAQGRGVFGTTSTREGNSWSLWKQNAGTTAPQGIVKVVENVREKVGSSGTSVTLSGHSAGGGFIFTFIDAQDKIPDYIDRIAFLDATYNYDREKHAAKLIEWLKRSPDHVLVAIAYDDRNVILNGKHIVSDTGGTYRANLRMIDDLGKEFPLTKSEDAVTSSFRGLNGRIELTLVDNPAAKILHTVIVEKNGFIHANTVATEAESRADKFWGDPGYTKFISSE